MFRFAVLLAAALLVTGLAQADDNLLVEKLKYFKACPNCACPGCDLSGADLSGVDLTDANLCDALLIGAKLDGADLWRANVTGCFIAPRKLHKALRCRLARREKKS